MRIAPIKVITAQFLIRGVFRQPMPGHGENAMPHGHQRTPLIQACGQSAELCREIRVLRPGSRPGRLGQGAPHIGVTLSVWPDNCVPAKEKYSMKTIDKIRKIIGLLFGLKCLGRTAPGDQAPIGAFNC